MGQLTILPGGGAAGTLRGPIYDDRLSSAGFSGIAVEQWMWSKDGLGLRPGVDLMVYAIVYAASRDGGLLASSCAELSEELGCTRETVTRSVARLVSDCLIWSPAEVRSHDGGRPIRCYCCCQGPLTESGIPPTARLRVSEPASRMPPTQGDAGAQNPLPGFQQSGGDAHKTQGLGDAESHSQSDDGAQNQCDPNARNGEAHIGENGPSPAQTSVFDTDHISTYNLQKESEVTSLDTGEEIEGQGEGQADGKAAQTAPTLDASMFPEVQDLVRQGEDPLLESDLLAFSELVESSLLPVDDEYLAQNLIAFKRLVDAGVPADVILIAYSQYAAYWYERRRKKGEFKPMHLLNWLRQKPNEQIRHVIAQQDEHWRRTCQHAGRKGRTKPTHENPRIERCLERDKPIYYVTDERGGRLIKGSRGVEQHTVVMGLYEHMYALETLAAKDRSRKAGTRGYAS